MQIAHYNAQGNKDKYLQKQVELMFFVAKLLYEPVCSLINHFISQNKAFQREFNKMFVIGFVTIFYFSSWILPKLLILFVILHNCWLSLYFSVCPPFRVLAVCLIVCFIFVSFLICQLRWSFGQHVLVFVEQYLQT